MLKVKLSMLDNKPLLTSGEKLILKSYGIDISGDFTSNILRLTSAMIHIDSIGSDPTDGVGDKLCDILNFIQNK